MTADAIATDKLDIGRVMRQIFPLLRRNLANLLRAALVFSVVPSLVNIGLGLALTKSLAANPSAVFSSPSYYLILIVALLGAAGLQSTGLLILMADLRGQSMNFSESLRWAAPQILPVFAIYLLYSLAVWFGLILLIVPGLVIATAFSMASSVRILEGKGVFAAFRRSRDLTRRNRWRIFSLGLVWLAILLAISLASFALTRGLAGVASTGGLPRIIVSSFAIVLGVAYRLIFVSAFTVVYAELRRIKDGIGPADLAEVFD